MKILLIYPPGWIRYNLLPPLGIAILATVLRNEGHIVKQCNIEIDIVSSTHRKKTKIGLEWVIKRDIISQYLLGHTPPELAGFLHFLSNYQEWNSYDAVCFSTLGELQVFSAAVIAKYIKNLYPEIKTILGGVFPVSMPEKTSQLLEIIGSQSIDIIYTRDDAGQQLVVDILRSKDSHETLEHVPQKSSSGPSCTVQSYHRPTFDFSICDQLDMVKSIYGLTSSHPMLQYLVSQGCSSKCAFCTRCQKTVALRRPSDVAEDLLYLSEK
ncbi:MAG: cobalamin-dependent protein, partial [Desulfobulbaceae bacterium]|nr:cobalamin-dependent protein [Desulfobulbaceae bacterium]